MNQLKELRKCRNLNQKDVADYLGITQQAYQKYEYGTSEMSGSTITKLADFYGVTTDYLLGREPLPNPLAELGLTAEDEAEVWAKYKSLPPEMRACLLEALRQLGGAVKSKDDNGGE